MSILQKVPLKFQERERRRKQASKQDEYRIKKINTGFKVLHLVLSLCIENRKGEVTILPAPSLYSSPDLYAWTSLPKVKTPVHAWWQLIWITLYFSRRKKLLHVELEQVFASSKKRYVLFEKLYVFMQNNVLKYKYLKLNREMKYNMGIIFSTLSYNQGNIFKISKLIQMH